MVNHTTPHTIIISGASGSGKSTAANYIATVMFPSQSVCLSADSYYLPRDARPPGAVDFDNPTAIEHDLLALHLAMLRDGASIHSPIYDFKQHDRTETVQVNPAPYIIIEGIFALHIASIRALGNMKIFIDADEEVCLARRLRRNIERDARSTDDDKAYFYAYVIPSIREYISPSQKYADYVIDNNGNIEQLKNRLNSIFSQHPKCAT